MTRKLTLAMLALFLPLLLLCTYALTQRSFSLMMERELERMLMEEAILAGSVREPLQTAAYSELCVLLSRLRAMVTQQGLEVTLLYGERPVDGSELPARYGALIPEMGRQSLLDTQGEAPRLLVSERMSQYVTLLAGRDVSDLYELRRSLWRSFAAVGAIGAVLVAALSLFVARLSVRPVKQLAHAAQAIASGEAQGPALPLTRRDETGELARRFDEMRAAIAAREEALRSEAQGRQELIDALAHEMRTPLTAMLGYARLLQTAALDEAQRGTALRAIARETQRLADMDKRLLLLTRLPHEEIVREDVNGRLLLAQAAGALKPLTNGVRLCVKAEGEAVWRGDPELLYMLAQNLCVNAVRASAPGQEVVLTAFADGFSVQDAGRGMTPEQCARACEPFYKADKARTRSQGGAGLGLTLCARICAAHGGRLRIDSEPGKGTTVRVYLGK